MDANDDGSVDQTEFINFILHCDLTAFVRGDESDSDMDSQLDGRYMLLHTHLC